MARYARADSSERRTVHLGVQLTPTEQAELADAARLQGARTSEYVRELLFRRSSAVVASTRRNPEAAALLRELSAIGNNLNQLAKRANETRRVGSEADLQAALELQKQAIAHVLTL
jgi:hypothetical protein